jgi:hypothetical protein
MRGKIVLAVVLCLAVAALLGIAAAPAAAQGNCKGWSPHPDAASLVRPTLTLTKSSSLLIGRFRVQGRGTNGVVVYLQQKLWGETEFTDLGQVTTCSLLGKGGWYRFTVPSPTPYAAYRAITEGMAGPPVVVPAEAIWRPTPPLTMTLSGLTNGMVKAEGPITARGRARPLKLAGEKVKIIVSVRLPKLIAGPPWHWVREKVGTALISTAGTYKWTYRPVWHDSLYRVRAWLGATTNHKSAITLWHRFRTGF